MDGVLNETTNTVHKQETGTSDLQTECGVAYTVAAEQLRATAVSHATAEFDASKCGRCFEDGRGY